MHIGTWKPLKENFCKTDEILAIPILCQTIFAASFVAVKSVPISKVLLFMNFLVIVKRMGIIQGKPITFFDLGHPVFIEIKFG